MKLKSVLNKFNTKNSLYVLFCGRLMVKVFPVEENGKMVWYNNNNGLPLTGYELDTRVLEIKYNHVLVIVVEV